MAIKAIETEYKGHLFRSRLEARWAVFFDTLGIEYEYEPEGYDTPYGWYLPDFRLPGFYRAWGGERKDYWLEIKGDRSQMTNKDRERWFAENVADYTYAIMYGNFPDAPVPDTPPGFIEYEVDGIKYKDPDDGLRCLDVRPPEQSERWYRGYPARVLKDGSESPAKPARWGSSTSLFSTFGRPSDASWHPNSNLSDEKPVSEVDWNAQVRALRAARSARFEHGQKGAML